MPDRRKHRGPHPDDAQDFAPERWPALRTAVADLAWLLDRGYSQVAALKLVGDRFELTKRQRTAVVRSSCTTASREARADRRVDGPALAGAQCWLDGYNVLITVEAALAGGVLLRGRDGALRDLASLHGTFRQVEETLPALQLIGSHLAAQGAGPVTWWLDRPVSNSGRLRRVMTELSEAEGWNWTVELVNDPDAVIGTTEGDPKRVSATSDSVVLDRCGRWYDLPAAVVDVAIPDAAPIELG